MLSLKIDTIRECFSEPEVEVLNGNFGLPPPKKKSKGIRTLFHHFWGSSNSVKQGISDDFCGLTPN